MDKTEDSLKEEREKLAEMHALLKKLSVFGFGPAFSHG